jgi:hypothetical protein
MISNTPDALNVPALPDIREAYPLINPGFLDSQQGLYLWFGLGILLLLCVFFLLYRWMKRPSAQPTISPLERAWVGLSEAETLLNEGQLKAFSQKLSLVLRQYIESRHHIAVLELTTEEFSKKLKTLPHLNPSEVHQLIYILQTCDTFKFSNQRTADDRIQLLLERAKAFIRSDIAEPDIPTAAP